MNSVRGCVVVFCVAILICGCQQELSETELHDWLADENNGAFCATVANGATLRLQYYPSDLFVVRECRSKRMLAKVDSIRRKYLKYRYFKIIISYDQDIAVGDEAIRNLCFRLPSYLKIHNERNETLSVIDFVTPQFMTSLQEVEILFLLDAQLVHDSEILHFLLKDPGVGIGATLFKISVKAIESTPKLRIGLSK